MTSEGIFQALGPLGGDRAELRFEGTLSGEAVRWKAVLCTLARYRRDHPAAQLDRNLIEVGAAGPDGRDLLVVLDLPCIDAPAAHKTVLMIRQWKRLAPGRHCYGGSP